MTSEDDRAGLEAAIGLDGAVDSDVSHFRDTPALISFPATPGVTCHECGSGEVYQPFQTCGYPMVLKCLRCGLVDPSEEFNRS